MTSALNGVILRSKLSRSFKDSLLYSILASPSGDAKSRLRFRKSYRYGFNSGMTLSIMWIMQ